MIFSLIALGCVVGILSSLLGIGGGALIVPVLILLFPNFPVQNVMATSLCFIFFNSLLNNLKFKQSDLVIDYKKSMKLNISAVIGGLLGGQIALGIGQKEFKIGFAIVLLLIVMRVLFSKVAPGDNENVESPSYKFYVTGLFGGFLSSITGLGGGAIFVPLLLSFVRLPMKFISPYSNLAMSFATLSGLVPQLLVSTDNSWTQNDVLKSMQLGNVNFALPLLILCGAFATSSIGVRMNTSIEPKTKKYIFSALLFILAVKTLWGVYKV